MDHPYQKLNNDGTVERGTITEETGEVKSNKIIRCSKEQLLKDINYLVMTANKQNYLITPKDIFAIGYLAGKYGLKQIVNNQDHVIYACQQYDKTDDLGLLDTIGETLIDLKVIINDGSI